jgi:dipeptidyl aminopeptidase/acylaminoacyl peptidase
VKNVSDIELTWQSPLEPINQILDALPPPTVLISPNQQWLVELEQPLLFSIALLAEPELALAGFRLNPNTNGPARHNPYRRMTIKAIMSPDSARTVEFPDNPQIGFLKWSPDGQKLAFTLTQATGLELWVIDLVEGTPRQLTKPVLNAAYDAPHEWLSNETLLCKIIPGDRGTPPPSSPIPSGPLVQENLGRKTPTVTYTNLLQHPHDEALFEYYLASTLEIVTLKGERTSVIPPCLIHKAVPSPDGRFILLKTWHRPFSYQVPVSRFPECTQVLDQTGKLIYDVADLPLDDQRSTKFDAVRTGRRDIFWRSDRPSTLYWVEALDGGDPACQMPYRDALFELDAPFRDPPQQLWQSQYRFRGVAWGRDDVALTWEWWYDTRKVRMWRIHPNQPETLPHLLFDRSYEDKYSDPGSPLMVAGAYSWKVLQFDPEGNGIYLRGRGASPKGVYPFLDYLDLRTKQTQRLWHCQDPYFEEIINVLDNEAQILITRRQSGTEPPNYLLVSRGAPSSPILLTHYQDPAPELAGIHKEVVRYQRADGVQLSAKLYLPPGYDATRDGPLPMLFWVYPEEFKDREFAGQLTTAENTFNRPSGTSVLFLLTQGYAILSGPSLPIIGEGDAEPNDTYVEQLVAGAQAAVNYVVQRGVADRDRLGIGGHSYGAFTTVNLLAHTDLFQMGIARSGAYNRTLTPFGFQGEQRNFWEATETYIHMSPFTHVAKVTAPLLLIHGANDSNVGTYPMQTERLYEALKGVGATVRWVLLPLEDHGYRSREGVAHMHWEIVNWCDRYLRS